MEVKRDIRKSILLPTLMYGSKTRTWNTAQQSTVCSAEITYLGGVCGVIKGSLGAMECIGDAE